MLQVQPSTVRISTKSAQTKASKSKRKQKSEQNKSLKKDFIVARCNTHCTVNNINIIKYKALWGKKRQLTGYETPCTQSKHGTTSRMSRDTFCDFAFYEGDGKESSTGNDLRRYRAQKPTGDTQELAPVVSWSGSRRQVAGPA